LPRLIHFHEQLSSPTFGQQPNFSGHILKLEVTGLFRIRKQGGGLVVNAFYLINAIGGCDSAASGIVPG
jgi:hypothetical protein